MNHEDHVALLRPGVHRRGEGAVWADMGAGDGAFTLALAELLGAGATLYTVDRDGAALARGAAAVRRRFPAVAIRSHTSDFRRPLALPALDGLVMANALHFVATGDRLPLLRLLVGLLQPGGRFLLVEYDVDQGNPWVPHPLSFEAWREVAPLAGLTVPALLGRRPSRFLRAIYSAAASPA